MPADEPLPPGTPQPNAEPDRSAQPVDDEQPPHLPFPVVGVGASAGGLEAFGEFLGAMRADSGMAFVFILHLPPDVESHLAEVLARRTAMPVHQVEDGMPVQPNRVYVIRPGHVLTIRGGTLRLGPELGGPRAANRPIDDFFRSLAAEQRERAVCVVLSGMGSNGTAGAQAIKAVGGLCVAQDPESAAFASMPRHLIDAGYADSIARPADLPDVLLTYAGSPYATGGREADAAAVLEREQQHLREVLAILRTRTKQDFTGYKKPTVLRRVQRRMGLARVPRLAEYAKLLRQSPTEVIALADDLLIHVTGFFRDPEAWAVLYERVVVPLVEAREPGAPVRAWVTACSSGEEAYSLAMLLTEESERTGKRLDIKVFATDLAERALSHARSGGYPGGIESEIAPDRLARFFVRQDEMYWIRQDLRDRVVFAPQNVLQDPPFSRLDIASCRNLLIYLEPEVQKRVLTLLHFGLREGGALFLGSSETLSGAEELFETVDKKARIFRRVGPTRHGVLDFPLPRALPLPARPAAAGEPRPEAPRAPVAELTRRVLLDAHTPPAVTVDRDFHIVYYHGDTRPFLEQLSGEPTRDLLLLARDGVRAAVRVALHRAAADGRRVSGPEGWVDAPDRRVRVRVTVSPFPLGGTPPEFYIVSFEDRGDVAPPPLPGGAADGQVQRLQDELRGAVEELQTSNEELKAANEEVMSINEELQSANEELETSKEEMQSLNEELRTVNAQLRAKMEEHQGAASDLASLLTSTDIAVLFLDPALRIRRYTPAVRDLVDLIATDVGRPLDAMARRFADPHLDDDCAAVLARLLPAEREVPGADGRHYLRRVTPYRTVDNRIDGVVVTFVDVTARKRAEDAVRAGEDRLRRMLNIDPVGVLVFDPAGVLVEANDAFVRMSGYAREHVAARELTWRGLTPPEYLAESERQLRLLAETGHLGPYEKEHFRRDGSRRWMMFAGARLADGTLVEYALDVSDRKRAEAELRASEERLRQALSAARMGVWSLDPGTGLHTRDAILNRMLGLDPAETTRPFAEFLAHVHPDDRAAVQAAFAASDREGRPLALEFRVVWPDGTVRWLRDQGDVFGAGDGRRMAGACVDVTDRRSAEEAVRGSEERLRRILESATDHAILTLDAQRRVTTWSPGAAAMFGHAEGEILGRPADELFTPEDRAAGAPAAEAEQARRAGRAADERWHLREDGSRFWASGVLTPLGPGGADGFVKVLRDLTDRKRMEDELRAARDQLEARVAERTTELAAALESLEGEMGRRADLARRLSTAQEDERKRVARDLHDSVGQLLAGLALAFKAVEGAAVPPPVAAKLADAQRVADALGKEVHALAVRLRPTSLDDLGLEAALAQLVNEWSARSGVRAEFHAAGIETDRLPAEVETTVYRVVQEALTNIARHAGATAVGVVVRRTGGYVSVVVEDNGSGFDPSAATDRLGLVGMRERVSSVGGELEIESRPGAGTSIIITIPVPTGGMS